MPLLRHLKTLVARWQVLIKDVRDPYRPELHYMRGPGPKWRARHQGVFRD
jgi:hypothetical protein